MKLIVMKVCFTSGKLSRPALYWNVLKIFKSFLEKANSTI